MRSLRRGPSSPGRVRERWSRYLLDDGSQLEAEVLAELAQVGEAAGPQGTVRIPGTPQESSDQWLPVLEHHVPCKGEQSPVTAMERPRSSCQSPGSFGNRWVGYLPCNTTEQLDATSGAWLVPLSTNSWHRPWGSGTFQSSHGITHGPANTPSVNLKFPHHPDPIPCPN